MKTFFLFIIFFVLTKDSFTQDVNFNLVNPQSESNGILRTRIKSFNDYGVEYTDGTLRRTLGLSIVIVNTTDKPIYPFKYNTFSQWYPVAYFRGKRLKQDTSYVDYSIGLISTFEFVNGKETYLDYTNKKFELKPNDSIYLSLESKVGSLWVIENYPDITFKIPFYLSKKDTSNLFVQLKPTTIKRGKSKFQKDQWYKIETNEDIGRFNLGWFKYDGSKFTYRLRVLNDDIANVENNNIDYKNQTITLNYSHFNLSAYKVYKLSNGLYIDYFTDCEGFRNQMDNEEFSNFEKGLPLSLYMGEKKVFKGNLTTIIDNTTSFINEDDKPYYNILFEKEIKKNIENSNKLNQIFQSSKFDISLLSIESLKILFNKGFKKDIVGMAILKSNKIDNSTISLLLNCKCLDENLIEIKAFELLSSQTNSSSNKYYLTLFPNGKNSETVKYNLKKSIQYEQEVERQELLRREKEKKELAERQKNSCGYDISSYKIEKRFDNKGFSERTYREIHSFYCSKNYTTIYVSRYYKDEPSVWYVGEFCGGRRYTDYGEAVKAALTEINY